MLISIIVPVYNVEQYIPRCIDSLLGQTYRDLQIIIVNDGSTDNSLHIIEKYNDPRIEIVNKINGGLSSARNEGLKHVKGDYVTFVDSDDWVDSEMIAKMADQATTHNSDIVCVQEKATTNEEESGIYKNYIKIYHNDDCMTQLLTMRVKNYTWGKLYKKNIFVHEECRFPEGMNYEDVATSYKFFYYCKTLVVLPDVLYFYYQRPGSIVKTKRIEEVESMIKHIEEMQRRKILNPYWDYYKLKILYGTYVYLLRLPKNCKQQKKYDQMKNMIESLRDTIKLSKPLICYVMKNDFYKVFLLKMNMVKLALLRR